MTFTTPFSLPPDQYFFVPRVEITTLVEPETGWVQIAVSDNGVGIASANASHYAAAKAALLANLHVMLEKPMTLFAADAKELVDLSRQQGKELIVGYPFNFASYATRPRETRCCSSPAAIVDLPDAGSPVIHTVAPR